MGFGLTLGSFNRRSEKCFVYLATPAALGQCVLWMLSDIAHLVQEKKPLCDEDMQHG